MKKVLILVAVLAMALSACGGTGALKAAKAAKDPEVQKREKQAQQIVQACVAKGNFITHAGRQKVIECIAPPGQKAKFTACAQKAIASNGMLTKGQRKRSYTAVADCVVSTR